MHFEYSQILWLTILIVALLGLFFWWSWQKRSKLLNQFVHAKLVKQLTLGVSPNRRLIKIGLLMAAVALLLTAVARPKLGFEWQEMEMQGLDILVAVDTSKSMLANDQNPNRIERAKLAVLDLMRLAKRDRLGLIAFSGTAFLQCPLTIDRNAFTQSVNSLNTKIIPQGGTAIGEAVNEAVRAFKKEEDNHRVLVLFTDGEDHEEGIDISIKKAKEIGLKVFTVGIGTPEGELIQIRNSQTGNLDFLKDESGNVVKSRLNENLLRQLSTDTGAFYLPMQGADTAERLYSSGLAGLTPSRVENQMTKRFTERYRWPLGLAILLLIIEKILPEVKRLKQKHATSIVHRTAAIFIILTTSSLVKASTTEARVHMDNGDYSKALEVYERIIPEYENDSSLKARLQYNAGTAAYNAKDYVKAEEYFRKAINQTKAPISLQQRAFYNLGNSKYRLGETTQNPDEKIKQWTEALKQFQGAHSLSKQVEGSPEDEDALFNSELVKKRLKQLEQQQQQQQQGDKKQKNEEEQENQQQNSENNKNEEEQQNKDKQSEEKEKKEEEGKQKEQKQSNQQQNKDKQEQKKQSGAKGDEEKEQAKPGQSPNQSDSEQTQKDGKMTPEQAKRLLDSLKQQERSLIYKPTEKRKANKRGKIRDW